MKQIIFILGLVASLYSCEEKGLLTNDNQISYVSFALDATKDTTVTSFVLFKEPEDGGAKEIDIKIGVTVNGKVNHEDLVFNVSADPTVTTLPSDKYILPEKCIIKAGQFTDTITVHFINFDELKTKNMFLGLRVNETETIKRGNRENSIAVISVTDRIFKPEWWTVLNFRDRENIAEAFYLGSYSDKKYLMFLEELQKDGVEFDGKDTYILRKYSLRLKNTIKEFNEDPENIKNGLVPLWDEENNEAMQVPVAG